MGRQVEMRLDALARDLAKQAQQRSDDASHMAVMYATPGMPLLLDEAAPAQEEAEAPPMADWLQNAEGFEMGANLWYGSGEVTDPEQLAAQQEMGNPR